VIRQREACAGLLFVLPWVLSLLIFTSYPVIATFYLSFTDYNVQSAHATDWARLMTASTLTALPLVVLFFFTQRYFLRGITLTGLKG
jgi:ABC-type glycerol-3-phosphate transport system permease component